MTILGDSMLLCGYFSDVRSEARYLAHAWLDFFF